MMEKAIIEISSDTMNKLFEELAKNAFERLHTTDKSWYDNNPFTKIVKEVFKEKEGEVKKVVAQYLTDIVHSDEFYNAVRTEYTAMLAKAMLANLGR